jgi:hypothetical protein
MACLHPCPSSGARPLDPQWAILSPFVEPVAVRSGKDGIIEVEVIQKGCDLDGQPLEDQGHGLKDRTVLQVFRIRMAGSCALMCAMDDAAR